MIYEVSAAGHCDPGIAGSNHVCAGVKSKNKHPQKTEDRGQRTEDRKLLSSEF